MGLHGCEPGSIPTTGPSFPSALGLPACQGVPHSLSLSPQEEFSRNLSFSFRVQEAQGRRQTQLIPELC